MNITINLNFNVLKLKKKACIFGSIELDDTVCGRIQIEHIVPKCVLTNSEKKKYGLLFFLANPFFL